MKISTSELEHLREEVKNCHRIIESLKQPEQEPVAWMSPHLQDRDGDWVYDFSMYRDDYYMFPVYKAPLQRPWVGLTDDDKVLIKHDANFNQFMTAGEYADRVQELTEARLKDKNNV